MSSTAIASINLRATAIINAPSQNLIQFLIYLILQARMISITQDSDRLIWIRARLNQACVKIFWVFFITRTTRCFPETKKEIPLTQKSTLEVRTLFNMEVHHKRLAALQPDKRRILRQGICCNSFGKFLTNLWTAKLQLKMLISGKA